VAQHGHQRRDARAARDEQQRPARSDGPGEVAADRPAQSNPVARPGLVDEPGRHLPALEPLDREREPQRLGRGGDRVAPVGLVAVIRGEPDIDVLPRAMAGPVRHVEN
jgi:hypothetical protein